MVLSITMKNRLLENIESHIVDDLGWSAVQFSSILSNLKNNNNVFVEFAHTPQIGHLGIFRLIHEAIKLEEKISGSAIFILNEHLPPRAISESKQISISINGKKISDLPTFGIPKKKQTISMSKLPSPNLENIEKIKFRLLELRPKQKERITKLAEIMEKCSLETGTHAHWLTRVFLELTGFKIATLSTERLIECADNELLDRLKLNNCGWAICDNCGLKNGRWKEHLDSPCIRCSCASQKYFPDVIGRQIIANSIFTGIRLSGGAKGYQLEADKLSHSYYGHEPLERCRITGDIKFKSLDGFVISRPSIVQYFIEADQNHCPLTLAKPEENLCLA